jgi:hypothetical protein
MLHDVMKDPYTKELKMKEYMLRSVLKERTELPDIEYNHQLFSVQWLFIPPHFRGFTITLIKTHHAL